MYTYTNAKGDNYILYWSELYVRGGKKVKIYYLLREDKKPANKLYETYKYKGDKLPKEYIIKEIGKNHTPLVYKVRNGKD